MKEINVWTDGSATVKDERLGGSGVYIRWPDGREEMYSKGWSNTKTGRAEIHAFLIALSHLPNELYKVTFYMDSEYVIKSILEYMPKWIENNWMGYAGPVKNKDLWLKVIDEFNRTPKLLKTYIHVKGHQKDRIREIFSDNIKDDVVEGNAIVDYLADYKKQTFYEKDL